MQTEIEVKFLNIDPISLRHKLSQIGAKLIAPERLMRRRNLDFPDRRLDTTKSAWVRVRDEGKAITMSYKQTNDYSITGTQEINLTIDNFDMASKFLSALGLAEKSYQETRRESWSLNDVDIEIDTWPWIPPFIELEGQSEAELKSVAKLLELNWTAHRADEISAVYQRHYDATIDEIVFTNITFGPVPDWLEAKRRPRPLS